MNWISTKEALPPIQKRVLLWYNERCWTEGRLVSSDYISSQRDGVYSRRDNHQWTIGRDGENKGFGLSDFRVTHWCEIHLPKDL